MFAARPVFQRVPSMHMT